MPANGRRDLIRLLKVKGLNWKHNRSFVVTQLHFPLEFQSEYFIYTYKICGIRIKKIRSLSLSDYTMPPPNTLHSHSTRFLHGTCRTLTPLIKNTHSCLSTTICRHCLNFISRRSFSTYFNHLKRGLPILRLPFGLLTNVFLSTLPRFILMRCFIHSNLVILISGTMSNIYVAPAIPY